MLKNALGHVRLTYRRHVFVAVVGVLSYFVYIAAWQNWRYHVSEIAGFVYLFGSMPWSVPWLSQPSIFVGGYKYVTYAVVALGFGVNCGILSAVLSFVRSLARPNNSFKPRPLRGSA